MANIPMGVSQWKNHGKKWGYWRYHITALLEGLLVRDFSKHFQEGKCSVGNCCYQKTTEERNDKIKKIIEELRR